MKKLFPLLVLLLFSILNPMPRRNRMKAGQRLAKGACLIAFSLLSVSTAFAASLGTAVTYQGRLTDGANSANGVFDLRFTIYDAAGGGSVVGVLTNAATPVTNGLFTVTLDFGSGVFDGNARWLEIAVRTNGAPGFATLTPRQPLTPTPYAILAGTASGLSGTLPMSQVSGVVPLAQLPAAVMTNYATSVSLSGFFTGNFGGSFYGNGGGLTGLNPANLSAGTAAINISGNAATATTATTASNAYNLVDGAGNVVGYSIASYATNVIPSSWDTNHAYASGFGSTQYNVTFTYVSGSYPDMTMYSNATTHAFIVWTNDLEVGQMWELGHDDYDSSGSGSPYDLTSTNNYLSWQASYGDSPGGTISLGTNILGTNIVVYCTNYFTGNFIGNGTGLTNLTFIGNGAGLTNLSVTNLVFGGNSLTGSFLGSFTGNGSGLTNLIITNFLHYFTADYYTMDYCAWRDLQALSIPGFNNYTPSSQTNSAAAFQNSNHQREILLLGTGLVGLGMLNYVWQNPAVTNSYPIAGYGCMNIVDSTHPLGAAMFFAGKDGYWLGPYTGTTNSAGTNRFWWSIVQPWNIARIDCAIGPAGSSWKLQTNSGNVNEVYVDTDMPVAVTTNATLTGKSFYWTNPFGPQKLNAQMVSVSGGTNRFLNLGMWDSTIPNGLIVNEQQQSSSHPSEEIQNTNIMGVFMTNWNPCLILWESPESTNTIGPLTNVISFCQYSCPKADIVLCGDYPMGPDNRAEEQMKLQYAKQYNVAYFDGWMPFEGTNNMVARSFYLGIDFTHASTLGYQTYGYFLTRYLMLENFLPQTIPSIAPSQLSAGNLPATVTNTAPVSLAQLPSAVLTNNQPGVTLSGTFTGNGGGLTNLAANAVVGGLTTNLAVLVPGGGTNTLCFTNGILRAVQ